MINKRAFKVAISLLICVGLVITIMPRVKTIIELSARKTELEKQKVILVEKHELLAKEFQEADSLDNMERIAREQLGMVKKGEQIIMPVLSNEN